MASSPFLLLPPLPSLFLSPSPLRPSAGSERAAAAGASWSGGGRGLELKRRAGVHVTPLAPPPPAPPSGRHRDVGGGRATAVAARGRRLWAAAGGRAGGWAGKGDGGSRQWEDEGNGGGREKQATAVTSKPRDRTAWPHGEAEPLEERNEEERAAEEVASRRHPPPSTLRGRPPRGEAP
uniref:Uncharacterized protein n=1 Tax=Oryza glaberrima TaxID=4538 RepID=I1R6N8_ORYGL